MSDSRKLLVLGAGRHQVLLIQRAEAAGYTTIIADNQPSSPGRRISSVTSMVSAIDLDGCRLLAREHQVSGILTCGTDQPVKVMARLSAELGLPCYLTPEGADLATNKVRQRAALSLAGVAQPKSMSCLPGEVLDWDTFPCVVKPADSQGQRGVVKVMDRRRFEAVIADAAAHSSDGRVIVEEYIDGTEVTANVWFEGGEARFFAVSDRIVYGKHNLGVCFQHVFPSVAAAGWLPEIRRMVEQIGRTFGVQNGPMYVQIMVSRNGPFLVEAAARLGGGHEVSLLPRLCDYDPLGSLLGSLEGRPYTGPAGLDPGRFGSVHFIFAREGIARELHGMERIPTPQILEGSFYIEPGASLGGTRDGQGRIGYFLSVNDSAESCALAAREFYAGLRVSGESEENLVLYPGHDELGSPIPLPEWSA